MPHKRMYTVVIVFLLLCLTGFIFLKSSLGTLTRREVESITAHLSSSSHPPFPAIDEAGLNETQKKIIQI